MNDNCFVTAAIVPGSHLKVKEIEEHRRKNWAVVEKADGSGKERKWVGTGRPEEDMAQYTELGLTPCVTNVIAGDLVLCKRPPLRFCPTPTNHGRTNHSSIVWLLVIHAQLTLLCITPAARQRIPPD